MQCRVYPLAAVQCQVFLHCAAVQCQVFRAAVQCQVFLPAAVQCRVFLPAAVQCRVSLAVQCRVSLASVQCQVFLLAVVQCRVPLAVFLLAAVQCPVPLAVQCRVSLSQCQVRKPSVPAEPSVSPGSRAVPSAGVSAESSVSPSSRAVPSVLPSSRAVPSAPDHAVLSVAACSRAVPGEVEKLAKWLAIQPSAIDRSDMELLCRALPLQEPHQGQDDCDGAFRAGMYIKGGIVGLHKSCRTHPWANKAISRYVLEQAATVGFSSHFTSAVVLVNTKTDPHKDQANMGEENIIIPVTCF